MAGVSMLTARFDDGPIRQHLARLALMDADGFTRARIEIGEFFVGEVIDNLQRQTLFDGSAMDQSKAAKDRDGKTLIDRGHLRDSYVYQLTGGGLEIGSARIYAAIHHFGGETGRKSARFTLPPRPILGLTSDGEAEIGDILIDEIRRAQA